MRKTIKPEELKDFLNDDTSVYNIIKIEFKDKRLKLKQTIDYI
ncbi:hypothetical protein [Brachyspira murdochii]|nr:hypothetical protein [Brachyspira murdochii]